MTVQDKGRPEQADNCFNQLFTIIPFGWLSLPLQLESTYSNFRTLTGRYCCGCCFRYPNTPWVRQFCAYKRSEVNWHAYGLESKYYMQQLIDLIIQLE